MSIQNFHFLLWKIAKCLIPENKAWFPSKELSYIGKAWKQHIIQIFPFQCVHSPIKKHFRILYILVFILHNKIFTDFHNLIIFMLIGNELPTILMEFAFLSFQAWLLIYWLSWEYIFKIWCLRHPILLNNIIKDLLLIETVYTRIEHIPNIW